MNRCIHAAPCLTCFIYWESDQIEVSSLTEFYPTEESYIYEDFSDEELELLMSEDQECA